MILICIIISRLIIIIKKGEREIGRKTLTYLVELIFVSGEIGGQLFYAYFITALHLSLSHTHTL